MKLTISDFCANREILEVLFAEKADLEHHYILSAHKQGECCKKNSPNRWVPLVYLRLCTPKNINGLNRDSKEIWSLYDYMFAVVSKHQQEQ